MATAAVARIAYLASDALIDIQPALPRVSPFSDTFKSLAKSSRSNASVISLPSGADPVAAALRQHNPSLISLTSPATSKTILNLVLRLSELSSLPIVLHFALEGDLSDVLLLRSAVPYFLLSSNSQEAHDNALLASKLARTQSNAVVHVFYAHTGSPQEVSEEQVLPFLLDDRLSNPPSPKTNGHANGVNGHANGANGHANGINGHVNGVKSHPNGNAQSSGRLNPIDSLFKAYESASISTLALVRRPIRHLTSQGSTSAETVIFTLGRELSVSVDNVLINSISLVTPVPASRILAAIPPTATRIIVLEDISRWSMKWTPIYLDVISALQQREYETRPIVQSGTLGNVDNLAVIKFLQKASSLRLVSSPLTGTESDQTPTSRMALCLCTPTLFWLPPAVLDVGSALLSGGVSTPPPSQAIHWPVSLGQICTSKKTTQVALCFIYPSLFVIHRFCIPTLCPNRSEFAPALALNLAARTLVKKYRHTFSHVVHDILATTMLTPKGDQRQQLMRRDR